MPNRHSNSSGGSGHSKTSRGTSTKSPDGHPNHLHPNNAKPGKNDSLRTSTNSTAKSNSLRVSAASSAKKTSAASSGIHATPKTSAASSAKKGSKSHSGASSANHSPRASSGERHSADKDISVPAAEGPHDNDNADQAAPPANEMNIKPSIYSAMVGMATHQNCCYASPTPTPFQPKGCCCCCSPQPPPCPACNSGNYYHNLIDHFVQQTQQTCSTPSPTYASLPASILCKYALVKPDIAPPPPTTPKPQSWIPWHEGTMEACENARIKAIQRQSQGAKKGSTKRLPNYNPNPNSTGAACAPAPDPCAGEQPHNCSMCMDELGYCLEYDNELRGTLTIGAGTRIGSCTEEQFSLLGDRHSMDSGSARNRSASMASSSAHRNSIGTEGSHVRGAEHSEDMGSENELSEKWSGCFGWPKSKGGKKSKKDSHGSSTQKKTGETEHSKDSGHSDKCSKKSSGDRMSTASAGSAGSKKKAGPAPGIKKSDKKSTTKSTKGAGKKSTGGAKKKK